MAVARGSALEEVAPPSARRFDAADRDQLKAALIDQAQDESTPDPQMLRDWARQFAEPAYRQRLDTLLAALYH